MAESSSRARHRPQYLRMLLGVVLAYTLIIGFGDTRLGDPARVVLFWYLLWTSARLHTDRRWRTWALALGALASVVSGWAALVASRQITSVVIGASSVLLVAVSIAAITSTLRVRLRVDAATVFGVLCIYLLFALFFASVHQVLAAIQSPYLHGVAGHPSASDLLYFSVITLSTVGYGDITPASEAARAVTVVEALTGQLYLVSVVAGVVAGWRGSDRGPDGAGG